MELGMVADGGGIKSYGGYLFEMAITGEYPSYTKVLRAVSTAKIQQSKPGETVNWDKDVKIVDKLGGTDFEVDTTKTPPVMLYAVEMENGDKGYIEIQLPDGKLPNLDWMQDYPAAADPSVFKKTPHAINEITIDQTNGDRYYTSGSILMIETKGTVYQFPPEILPQSIKTISPLQSGGVYIITTGSKIPTIILPKGQTPPGDLGVLLYDGQASALLEAQGIPFDVYTSLDFPLDETIEGCVSTTKEYEPPPPNPCEDKTCDDINACTKNECNDATGECMYPPVIDGTPCDDGNPKTENDACKSGECTGTPIDPCKNKPCDDGNSCTTDGCDSTTGNCTHKADQTGKACDDGDPKTINDECVADKCVGDPIPPPDNPPDTPPDNPPPPDEAPDEQPDASEGTLPEYEPEQEPDNGPEGTDTPDAYEGANDIDTPDNSPDQPASDEAAAPEADETPESDEAPESDKGPEKAEPIEDVQFPDRTPDLSEPTEDSGHPDVPQDKGTPDIPPQQDQGPTDPEVTKPPKSGGGCNSNNSPTGNPETLFGIAALGAAFAATRRRVKSLFQRIE